jgi:hypothetical protein
LTRCGKEAENGTNVSSSDNFHGEFYSPKEEIITRQFG